MPVALDAFFASLASSTSARSGDGGTGAFVTRHARAPPGALLSPPPPPPPPGWQKPQAWQSQFGQCWELCFGLHHFPHAVIFFGSDGHILIGTVGRASTSLPDASGTYTMIGGSAGGPGGLQRSHARQSQLPQWSFACFALHHGAHAVRAHVVGAFVSSGILRFLFVLRGRPRRALHTRVMQSRYLLF